MVAVHSFLKEEFLGFSFGAVGRFMKTLRSSICWDMIASTRSSLGVPLNALL